jgi:hypothetical protein
MRAVIMSCDATNDVMSDLGLECTVYVAINPDVDAEEENHTICADLDLAVVVAEVKALEYDVVAFDDVYEYVQSDTVVYRSDWRKRS